MDTEYSEIIEPATEAGTSDAPQAAAEGSVEREERAESGKYGENAAEVGTPESPDRAAGELPEETVGPTAESRAAEVPAAGESSKPAAGENTAAAQRDTEAEALAPTLDKLRLLSAGCGQSLSELADRLLEASDRERYTRLVTEAGGNEELAKRLFDAENAERQAAYRERLVRERQAEAARKTALRDRLAADFGRLRVEYPGRFADFSQVPESVVRTAAAENISLYDAYLRFERAEQQRIDEAKQQQRLAAAAAAGSKADRPGGEDIGSMAAAVSAGFARAFA